MGIATKAQRSLGWGGEALAPLFVASCQSASFLGRRAHWMPMGLAQRDSSCVTFTHRLQRAHESATCPYTFKPSKLKWSFRLKFKYNINDYSLGLLVGTQRISYQLSVS